MLSLFHLLLVFLLLGSVTPRNHGKIWIFVLTLKSLHIISVAGKWAPAELGSCVAGTPPQPPSPAKIMLLFISHICWGGNPQAPSRSGIPELSLSGENWHQAEPRWVRLLAPPPSPSRARGAGPGGVLVPHCLTSLGQSLGTSQPRKDGLRAVLGSSSEPRPPPVSVLLLSHVPHLE